MQSSLRSFSGPRIKYAPDVSSYESITLDKLTPIIGGEIGGVDLRESSNRQMDEIHRALAENLVIFFRDQHLSPEQHLEGLTARHDGEHYRGQYKNFGIHHKESYPSANHPVVRTHPVTGRKALYVNKGFTRYINGLPRDESDGILRYLYEHMANPLFQCRFRWQENSIAFWDNRCVQHHAMWDYWPHTRSGNRVTVKGTRPV